MCSLWWKVFRKVRKFFVLMFVSVQKRIETYRINGLYFQLVARRTSYENTGTNYCRIGQCWPLQFFSRVLLPWKIVPWQKVIRLGVHGYIWHVVIDLWMVKIWSEMAGGIKSYVALYDSTEYFLLVAQFR